MEQFIGCDAHKTFSVFVAVNGRGATTGFGMLLHGLLRAPSPAEDLGSSRTWASHFGGSGWLGNSTGFS